MKKTAIIMLYILILIGMMKVSLVAGETVQMSGDRVSVYTDGEPLQNILKAFAGFGLKVRIDPGINPVVSARFENREIRSALEILLKNINYVLFWETIEGPLGPVIKISEIRVFYPGEEDRVVTLAPGNMGDIIADPRTGDRYVAGEILLKLRPELDIITFNRMLVKIGGRLIGSNPALGVYRIRIPIDTDIPAIVRELKASQNVISAEPNYAYPLFRPTAGAGKYKSIQRMQDETSLGKAPPIGVLDTGIVNEFGLEGVLLGQFNAADPDNSAVDSQGHGTQMALIASGMIRPTGVIIKSETVPLLAVKTVDDNGYVSNFSIMRAIDQSVSAGVRVLNLSWGAETRSGFLETALDAANQNGLIIVASAGNEPVGEPIYPAAYSNVIGVGALKPGGDPWEQSNYGEFVSVWAPGFAELPIGFNGKPGVYAGTSISAAFVANRIAAFLALHPDAGIEEILSAVERDSGQKTGDEGQTR